MVRRGDEVESTLSGYNAARGYAKITMDRIYLVRRTQAEETD